MTPDPELLRHYAEQGDEAAFAEVVRRQMDMVYSVALRVCRNAALAEEVAQGVFSTLARDAAQLARYDTIVGWLHTAARRRAIDAVRQEERRRAREQEAVIMQTDPTSPADHWPEIQPWLDEAVGQLREDDRKVVLLRFFSGLSHQEIGTVLGLSENSANKRVERALEKLRAYFSKRGVTTTAAILASTMGANSVQAAPVGLAQKLAPQALAGVVLGTGSGGWGLFISVMNHKIQMAVALAVLLVLGIALKLNWPEAESASPAQAGPSHPAMAAAVVSSGKAATLAPPPVPIANVAPQVEAPVMPAAAAPTRLAAATGEPPAPVPVPARFQIDTAMDDFANLIESGAYAQAADAYMQLPPNVTGQQLMDGLSKNPDFPNTVRMLLESTRAARTQAPMYNAEGDIATYTLNPPVEGKKLVRWKKINDAWYVDGYE